MDIIYNIEDIQTAVAKIDEKNDFADLTDASGNFLSSDRLVRLPYRYVPQPNTDSQLTAVQETCRSWFESGVRKTTGSFEALDRINIYLKAVKNNTSNLTAIFESVLQDANNTLSIRSSFDDVRSANTIFSLNEYNDHIIETFNLLSSFFDKSTTDVLTHDTTRADTAIDLTANSELWPQLLNQQNCNNTFETSPDDSDFQIKDTCIKTVYDITESGKTARKAFSSVIDCSDVLYILSMFIQRLKNTKFVTFDMTHSIGDKTTKLKSYAKIPVTVYEGTSTIATQEYANRGTIVSLILSPWTNNTNAVPDIQIIESQDEILNSVQNYKYTEDSISRQITLKNLVYDSSSGADILQTIPLVPDGTNGIFAHQLLVNKLDRFNLSLADVQKLYDIYPEEIISRKSLLNAIDYIFNYWVENISIIRYSMTTCHSNCHANTISTQYVKNVTTLATKQVTATGYLRYLGSGGCGCSTILSFTVNLYDMIPKVYRDDKSNLNGTNVKLQYTKGGYTENTESPNTISINASSVVGSPVSATSGTVESGINLVAGVHSLTVSAEKATEIKEKKTYFCMQVVLYADYTYKKEEKEESSS